MPVKKKHLWLKQISVLLMTLIILTSFVDKTFAGSITQYEQMTGEEKFTEIKEQVTHSALNVSKYKASDAYKEINKALDDFQKINSLVQKTKHTDRIIDKVANGLEEVANTYENIANFTSDISSNRKEEFANLRIFKRESLKTEQELKNEIAKVKSNNHLIQKSLDVTSDEIEQRKMEVSLKGNQSIINSLEAQRIIWARFYRTQEKMLKSLNLNAKKIDLLLHVLNVNASVYREAANVARLRRSAKGALESLRSLTDIQDIVGDLENSWLEVNDIVSEISNAEFTLDIE